MASHRSMQLALTAVIASLAGAASLVVFSLCLALSRPNTRTSIPTSYPPHRVLHATPGTETDYGQLTARVGDELVNFPELRTDYQVDVKGDLVAVTLTQHFINNLDVVVDATYRFPLERDAAVYGMKMRVGDEVIVGKVRERAKAQEEFEAAKEAGQAAALTEEMRPNLFQQSLANVMPGETIVVELQYTHAVRRVDGEYMLILPLGIGEAFTPPDADLAGLPAVAPVASTPDADRVSIDIRVDAGMPLKALGSTTHEIDVQSLGESDARVKLRSGRTANEHAFVLRYRLAGEHTAAGVLATYDEADDRGYFSLLIEPMTAVSEAAVVPREMVFVLDCSGSMYGAPLDTSKLFMTQALKQLRPTDTFRVIRFSDDATEYSTAPIRATPEAIEDALTYVASLNGTGGTHMTSGIMQALTPAIPQGTVRIVTFLTDGYIGNDTEVLRLVGEHIGEARIVSVGLGAAPNRFLLEELGSMGRGFSRIVEPDEPIHDVADELTSRVQSPLLTNLTLEADAGAGTKLVRELPDLFAGHSVRVAGSYATPGPTTFTLRGDTPQGPVTIPIEVVLPATANDGDAVRIMWARERVKTWMRLFRTQPHLREHGEQDADIQQAVTEIGLRHGLVTPWTSFVAVSNRPRLAPNEFAGGATPEPGVIGGLVVMLLGARAARRNARRDEGNDNKDKAKDAA